MKHLSLVALLVFCLGFTGCDSLNQIKNWYSCPSSTSEANTPVAAEKNDDNAEAAALSDSDAESDSSDLSDGSNDDSDSTDS